jgi:hypothetical protein
MAIGQLLQIIAAPPLGSVAMDELQNGKRKDCHDPTILRNRFVPEPLYS